MIAKKETIADWFEQYSNDIYHFLIYRTNVNVAEDLLQEVFIKALKGLHYFKGKSQPKTWLLSIARNIAIDEIRKKQTKKYKRTVPLESTHFLHTEETPESVLQFSESQNEIYQCLQQLSENYRDVIILRSIQDLSVDETGRILKWSEKKVTSTHYRARMALLKKLRRFEEDAKQ